MNGIRLENVTVFLLRHGHTPETSAGRYIGQTDAALSAKGIRQAERWAEWFSSVPLKRIACSGLKRSADTAAIIGRRNGVRPVMFPDLKEIDLGDWEGLEFDYVRKSFPEAYKRRGEDMAHFRPPGGESFLDLQKRVVFRFQELMQPPANDMLIVGHAGTNRVLLCHLLGMPLHNLFRLKQDVAALNIIAVRSSGWHLEAMNLQWPLAT
ncbi:MAG: histidine phosphatase family protein [Deltaproteobacteria bacterium]|nr:histidine phosphatase family protein [Deltaproteobacteria bacterium]